MKKLISLAIIAISLAMASNVSAEITHRTGDVVIGTAQLTAQDHAVTLATLAPSPKGIVYLAAETTSGITVYATVTASYRLVSSGVTGSASPASTVYYIHSSSSGYDDSPLRFTTGHDYNNVGNTYWTFTINCGSLQAGAVVNIECYYNSADN